MRVTTFYIDDYTHGTGASFQQQIIICMMKKLAVGM
jgi:hypothetical protein